MRPPDTPAVVEAEAGPARLAPPGVAAGASPVSVDVLDQLRLRISDRAVLRRKRLRRLALAGLVVMSAAVSAAAGVWAVLASAETDAGPLPSIAPPAALTAPKAAPVTPIFSEAALVAAPIPPGTEPRVRLAGARPDNAPRRRIGPPVLASPAAVPSERMKPPAPPPAPTGNETMVNRPGTATGAPARDRSTALTPSPPDVPASSSAGGGDELIYSAEDVDVTPPVAVRKWFRTSPPTGVAADRVSGFEILVSAAGDVESARKLHGPRSYTDGMTLSALKGGKFRPATRDGRPVAYRQTVWVVAPAR